MTFVSRAATNDELTSLRSDGQGSKFWVAFYKPNTIYTARLASLPSSNDMVAEIAFNTGSGTLADVKKEMTLWVGTTAGARDLGTCRIRKAAIAGTFYIDMTSKIDWQATCYLTVVDDFRLSRRTARMDAGTLNLDYETAYSDQYDEFEPVPVLGAHAILWLTGADVDALFDAGDSWVFGSTISSYAWSAPGASATSGMSTATPTITYDATGYYTVYCTVTAATGKTYTGVRHVFVFGSAFMPHAVQLTSDPSGSLENGGWNYSVKMYADADPSEVIEGCLAVLFSEDWYGGTKQSIGQVENRENVICGGYVDAEEDILWDAEISEVEFSITGAQAWLGEIEIPPIKLTMATDTPSDWDTMPALTVDRALWYLLHWRSNVTALMDVRLTDDARYLPETDTEGKLWDQVKDIAWNKIFALPYVDRLGRLFVNIHPQLVPLASRTWETVMTITEKDWKERINIRRRKPELSLLSMSGWICDLSGNVNVVYSLAMGHVDIGYGSPETLDKFLASDQSQFNTLAGMFMGWKNHELDFEISMGQNNRMVDLFPPAYLDISMAVGDTPRGIAYAGNLIPTSVTLAYDPEAMCFETVLECEQEAFAELVVDGDMPASTGWDFDDDFSIPPDDFDLDLSDLGEIVSLPASIENLNHPKVVVIGTTQGVFYTRNFDADDPTWTAMNNGLSASYRDGLSKRIVVTPNGAIWMICNTGLSLAENGNQLYRASGLGGTWELIATGTTIATSLGYANGMILAIAANPTAEQIAISTGLSTSGGAVYFRMGFGDSAGTLAMSSSWSDTLGGGVQPYPGLVSQTLARKGAYWYLFYTAAFSANIHIRKFTGGTAGSETTITETSAQNAPVGAALRGDGFVVWLWTTGAPGGKPGIWLVDDDGSVTSISVTSLDPSPNLNQAIAFSPTGEIGMGTGVSPYTPFLSTDSGASWSSVGGTMSTGSDVWENCEDNNRFLCGGGTTLKLTLDRGTTPINKAGNLGYVAPLVDITAIRFIE